MQAASAEHIGTSLQQLRHKQGLSLATLAKQAGVNKSTLSRWETGKTVPRSTELASVLSKLNVPKSMVDTFCQAAGQRLMLPESEVAPPVSGDLLRVLRLRRGLTQSEAARAANVPQGTLSKWERSEDWPAADRLHTLCFALGATPEETATLTRGRFLPSLLPEARTDSDALALLLGRRSELEVAIREGHFSYVEFGLLQLESDAWRTVQRSEQAKTVLLDTMQMQTMFIASHTEMEKRIGPLFRRGRNYVRALGMERHTLTLTQRIVGLQLRRDAPSTRGNDTEHQAIARALLALLPCTIGPSGAEYRSWIYMEAARNLASVSHPDVISVKRLVAASFAEPQDGQPRTEDPTAVRYAAGIYARIGQTQEAVALVHRAMRPGHLAFHGHLLLARIARAAESHSAAAQHLASAAALTQEMPQHQNLPQLLHSAQKDIFLDDKTTPRRVFR